jgi:hypothetical protein
MNDMKCMRIIAPLLAVAFALSGCNLIKINPERDGAQVVATVYGEKITKKEVYDFAGITWEQKVEPWEQENIKAQKEQALEYLIEQKVLLHVAKEKGFFDFTEEEQKEIDQYVTDITQSIYEDALEKYKEEAKTDPLINPEEKANADVDEYLEGFGYTRESLKQEKAESIAMQKLQDSVMDPVSPSDADVRSKYDSMLKEQQEEYDADPTQVIPDENNNGVTILYYPTDGFVRVRHILIQLPDDIQSQIRDMRSNNLNEEADRLRDDELKKIADKANEALAKAKEAGGDLDKLDALIVEYGEDPGMDYMTEGYLVYKDSKDYVQEFTDAAMALTEIGKPSELAATDYGYHILWLTKKHAKGAVPFDEVKDTIAETVKETQQSTAWANAVRNWMSEAESRIKRDTRRLHN